MKTLLVLVLTAFLASSFSWAQSSNGSTNAPKSFPTQGVVREKPEDGKTLVVRHEEIPGYMPKMTMELVVKNTNEVQSIKEGDLITFNLVVGEEDHYIDQIRRIGVTTDTNAPAKASISKSSELKPGDLMPDGELIDETGKKIRFSQFRGQALAFTFIFSRCPLPDYCPRMNKHFFRAREILQKDANGPANWQFLSISFDPDFDKPRVLKSYGDSYRGGSDDRWLFAAIAHQDLKALAPKLDFRFTRDAESFSHNLRTVVVDAKGRVFKQFDNNLWSAEDLAKAMEEAAAVR